LNVVLIYSPREVHAQFPAAIRAIMHYRLHHALSLNKLAAHMKAASCETPARTLLDLFAYADALDAKRPPRHRPRYLTKYNIVRFLVHLKARRKRAAGIRRRRPRTLWMDDFPAASVAADKA
jgi:hypothetical protein